MSAAKECRNCSKGRHFKPLPDEVARYGADIMECRRPGWEGYTRPNETCEAFTLQVQP